MRIEEHERLNRIEKTLGTLIAWLHLNGLLTDEVDKLLCMLSGTEEEAT